MAALGDEELLPEAGKQSTDMEEVRVGETYSCRGPDGIYHDAEVLKTRLNKRAGKEEFLVHYTDLANQKNEWVDKSHLVLSTPVMEVDTDNAEDQDMDENGTTDQTAEDEDGQPETKRAKVEATEDLENSLEPESEDLAEESEDLAEESEDLAEESEDLAKELTCPLCKSRFKDPVIISCSHNFCRTCIEEAWNGQESFVCPDCETVMTEKMYIANRALDNLVKKSISTAKVKTAVKSKPIETTMITANCPEHDERLKLFCKEDGALSCLICRDSLKHSGHNFLPIMDAVEMYRTQLSAVTAPLQEALKATRQLNSKQREKIQQAKTNMEECEQHVVTEFKKLKDFIQKQKETLLKQLQEQGKDVVTQMENNLTRVQENEKNIEQAISVANEKMNVTEATSFLTDTKSLIDKCREQQAQSSSSILVDKQLNENTYKGPILFSVWKEMRSLVAPNGDGSEAQPGGSLRGLFSTIGVPRPSTSYTIDRSRGGFLFPWNPVADGDTESGDQDNLAAQAPETGAQANQQTKPATPSTAPKTGAQANKQTKPATPSTASKTGAGVFGRPAASKPSTSSQPSQKATQKTGQNSQGPKAATATVSKPGMQRSGQTSQSIPSAVPSTAKQSGQIFESNPAAAFGGEAKHVWFFGNVLLAQAKDRAYLAQYGLDLGLQQKNINVHWKCREGMMWHHLVPDLKNMERQMNPPDVLIIHIGEDELEWRGREYLKKIAISTLREISSRYSDTVVMWSWMVPRWGWASNKLRHLSQKVNNSITQNAISGRFRVIPHPHLDGKMYYRWKMLKQQSLVPEINGPVNAELDMINMDFKAAILKVLPIS